MSNEHAEGNGAAGFDLNSMKVDPKKEVEGVEHDIGDGAVLRVARMNNPKYRKLFRQLTKPYRRLIQRDALSDEKADDLYNEAISKTILLGWRGLTLDGKELSYSQAACKKALDQFPDFRDMVVELAQDMQSYLEEEREELLGE